jgi:hypothetical protein
MRTTLAFIILAATSAAASAQYSRSYGSYGYGSNPNSNYVQPHVRSNSDFVGGHYRTNPNSTTLDNYGTSGNSNPYSGSYGRRKSGLYD